MPGSAAPTLFWIAIMWAGVHDAIVTAIACRSASIAEHALSVGTTAWLGFTDDLLWAEPFEAHFGYAAAAGPAALLAGRDVKTAKDSMKARFNELDICCWKMRSGRGKPWRIYRLPGQPQFGTWRTSTPAGISGQHCSRENLRPCLGSSPLKHFDNLIN